MNPLVLPRVNVDVRVFILRIVTPVSGSPLVRLTPFLFISWILDLTMLFRVPRTRDDVFTLVVEGTRLEWLSDITSLMTRLFRSPFVPWHLESPLLLSSSECSLTFLKSGFGRSEYPRVPEDNLNSKRTHEGRSRVYRWSLLFVCKIETTISMVPSCHTDKGLIRSY